MLEKYLKLIDNIYKIHKYTTFKIKSMNIHIIIKSTNENVSPIYESVESFMNFTCKFDCTFTFGLCRLPFFVSEHPRL